MNREAIMIGKTISHYRILEKLGAGGMGVVYKAEDTRLKRTVALKFLSPSATAGDEEKTRLMHEAQAVAALSHPSICTIHEIDKTGDGRPFIVMEFVEGESLKEMVARGQLSVDKVLGYGIQVAEGLEAAHEKGIIHRDMKCDNVMVNEKGGAKIMDFGLARLSGRTVLTKEGTTLGTIHYMSPEQARAEKVDHRTDIWSFGVMLYEMTTGLLPFRGEYEQAVVYSILNEDPEPPTALRSGVPMELERIILKALAREPRERYQRVDEMLVDLQAVRRRQSAREESTARLAGAERTPPAAAKPARRRTFLFGAVTVAVAVIAAAWWLAGPSRRPRPVGGKAVAKKVAVLPFVNMTADPKQEYFCDGMTEQLITNLSRLPELKVIARTSVMRYKNTEKDIHRISKELDARYVLEGSVRKSDKRVRITAQLIDAGEGTHLWADDYDRELRDIFAIQDDVSQSIARALEVTFSDQATKMVAAGYANNVQAYDSHLKARYYIDNVYLNTKSEADFQQALALARRTITLDPDHYLGYFDLAYAYENHWLITGNRGDMELERRYIRKAYQLNSTLPETNAAMGFLLVRTAAYDSAFTYLKAALAQPGSSWEPLHLVAANLSYLGLYRQAIAFYSRAAELNPFSLYTISNRGWAWLFLGDVDRAIQDFVRTSEIQPDYVYNLCGYALALIIQKNYGQADSLLIQAEKQSPGPFVVLPKFVRALYYAALGQSKEALAVGRWPGVLATLGMKDEAIDAIVKDTASEDAWEYLLSYLPLAHLPIYDSLRDDPQFQDIVERKKAEYEERLREYSLTETD